MSRLGNAKARFDYYSRVRTSTMMTWVRLKIRAALAFPLSTLQEFPNSQILNMVKLMRRTRVTPHGIHSVQN